MDRLGITAFILRSASRCRSGVVGFVAAQVAKLPGRSLAQRAARMIVIAACNFQEAQDRGAQPIRR